MTKRKAISLKVRSEVLKRDNYSCQSCGKSPALYPELQLDVVELEIDHIKPVSKDGSNNLDNLQTLCILCNRGKGNADNLNMTIKNKIDILLNTINPQILEEVKKNFTAKIVANDADYQELVRLNNLCNYYKIKVIPNTLIGYHAGYKMGIYTTNDNNAAKVNFVLSAILGYPE